MKKLFIEIADTPSRRSAGLMHRKNLAENSGMLFKFQHADHLRFWMRNTYIPLDIAFMDEDGTIFQIAEMYPLSSRLIVSDRPCKLALEVNHGWFSKNDIGIGDKIGGIEITDRQYRIAQTAMLPEEENFVTDMYQQGMDDAYQEQSDMAQDAYQNPKVKVDLDNRAKVRYAEQHNFAMQIVYQSKESGQTLPPRKLLPVPGEGYPIRVSEGGEYFVAYDSSATINGGEWQILGNQIKRFLFSNIIALEVLEEFVK
jgi:uncharacterized protein